MHFTRTSVQLSFDTFSLVVRLLIEAPQIGILGRVFMEFEEKDDNNSHDRAMSWE